MASLFSKIGSVFVSIETFVSNLFINVQKEYLNLEPAAQTLFTNLIKWGNILKGYITNPQSAGDVGVLITMAETLLGTTLTGLISSVLSEVLLDLQIIQTALTDPKDAYTALIKHLQQFSGTALGKELLKIVGTVAEKLSGLETNEVVMILAFVYKTFFQSTAATVTPPVAVATPVSAPTSLLAAAATIPAILPTVEQLPGSSTPSWAQQQTAQSQQASVSPGN